MSKKLKAAILAEKVSVRGKTSGETSVWFRDPEGKRVSITIGPFATVELAPKMTEAKMLHWSNLEELVKRGAIEIL